MRLTSFTLENYGCFAQARLALDPEPGHVNLVAAPNGSGKTVLRQAFRDLLFGIPGQTKMAFLYGYQGMRLFAEGIDAAGSAFAFGRRKGIGNTLVDAAGISLDPRILAPLIGEADEALFERLFGLDSQLLRSGAEAMLDSGGALAEALFAAGSGIASVRQLREKFEEIRDQLAPGRQAKARPFYKALDELAGAAGICTLPSYDPEIGRNFRSSWRLSAIVGPRLPANRRRSVAKSSGSRGSSGFARGSTDGKISGSDVPTRPERLGFPPIRKTAGARRSKGPTSLDVR